MDQANRDATFAKEDIFQRKSIGDGIVELIKSQGENHKGALTISIDAPWGMGKTTFLSMLENAIKQNCETEWCTIYYDAWENDMSGDPFTSMLFQVCGQLPQEFGTTIKAFIKEIFTSASNFLEAFPGPIPKIIGAGLGLAGEMVKHTGYDDISRAYSLYESHKKLFQDNLSSIANECKKLVIFIDELDRCKPTFAVNLLETIKHYYDIDNVVFVFGIDGIELCETIKQYYGSGFDSSSYLTRFFEYQISLPHPTIKQMLSLLENKYTIPSAVAGYLQKVFKYISITPREVKSIISGIEIIKSHYFAQLDDKATIYSGLSVIGLLLSIKCKNKRLYEKVLSGDYYEQSTKNQIENDLVLVSTICKGTVHDIIDTDFKTFHPPIFDRQNSIVLAFDALINDRYINIGYSLQKILNIIEIPGFATYT